MLVTVEAIVVFVMYWLPVATAVLKFVAALIAVVIVCRRWRRGR